MTVADCGMGGPYRCRGMIPCEPMVDCGFARTELCTKMCIYVPDPSSR